MSAPSLIARNPQLSPSPHHDSNDSETHEPTASEHSEHAAFEWFEIVRIILAALAALAVWVRLWEPFPHVGVIGIAATLIGGYPIFKEAFENITERKMTMELSMTIALLSALAIGEFFTALVITGFVLAAEVLEGLTVGRGRRAIQSLLDFLPRTVMVRRNDQVMEVASEQVQIGDMGHRETGWTNPGGRCRLIGRSFVAQAAITGEAMPVEKTKGDAVYAGTEVLQMMSARGAMNRPKSVRKQVM